jgi:hypothetical protein
VLASVDTGAGSVQAIGVCFNFISVQLFVLLMLTVCAWMPICDPGIGVTVFCALYVIGFAYSWGPVVWVVCAEMFPMRERGKANSLTTFSNWFWTCIVGAVFPIASTASLAGCFGFFAAVVFVATTVSSHQLPKIFVFHQFEISHLLCCPFSLSLFIYSSLKVQTWLLLRLMSNMPLTKLHFLERSGIEDFVMFWEGKYVSKPTINNSWNHMWLLYPYHVSPCCRSASGSADPGITSVKISF